MNVEKIKRQLASKYPGKSIFANPDASGEIREIICEIEPSSDHPEWSIAVAVIEKSQHHFHLHTTETYKVLQGELTLHVGEQSILLKPGESWQITPGNIHWAEGKDTWVECRSVPGWTLSDHILVRN
jgi:mannose-6-phosphate isomerase-like protein (cupin superfamily)